MNDIRRAALAGLLHDVGQLARRAGLVDDDVGAAEAVLGAPFDALWPADWAGVTVEAGREPLSRVAKAVQVADRLASGGAIPAGQQAAQDRLAPLRPIAALVELDKGSAASDWCMPLGAAHGDLPLPQRGASLCAADYQALWQRLLGAVRSFPALTASLSHFAGLNAVLREYLSGIPAAPPTTTDVSLYDHLKVAAALASCLVQLPEDTLEALHAGGAGGLRASPPPVARLLRGDLSGIQAFIYRITAPEAERDFRHTAQRLRGRSFYLTLLEEVVADWLLRELGLTAANALYVGGGRFDLLVPTTAAARTRVAELILILQDWLTREYDGVLGVTIAGEDVTAADLADLRRANDALDDQLAAGKRRKSLHALTEDFFKPVTMDHACEVCRLTPIDDEHVCPLCQEQQHIGAQLPKTTCLVRVYGPRRGEVLRQAGDAAVDFGDTLGVGVALLDDEATPAFLADCGRAGVECLVSRLNDAALPPVTWPALAAPSQVNLANAAPVLDGDVCDFDQIAGFSAGVKLLGILKADVDHLGLIFGLGLEPLTLARSAALSHTLDLFFGTYLNALCREVTAAWKLERQTAGQSYPKDLDSVFYVVYSGGDDLLIIGPWDQALELAARLNECFRAYTCQNPNVTLSAGLTLVKPHFPVQRFVQLADEALHAAKAAGRDRITAFGQTVTWTDYGSLPGLEQLQALAHDLRGKVEANTVPRTLVHDLGRLRHRDYRSHDGDNKALITPELLYLLTRRLPREVRDALKGPILDAWPAIRIPVSYVSLSTRKE